MEVTIVLFVLARRDSQEDREKDGYEDKRRFRGNIGAGKW